MSPHNRNYIAICVHYGEPMVTEQTIRSLLSGTSKPDEILIIDHAEAPLSLPQHKRVRIIRPENNGGYGGGVNIGLGALFVKPPADEDIIVVMNCDAEVKPAAILKLKRWWAERAELALMGPQAGFVDMITGRAELVQYDSAQKLVGSARYKPYIHGAWFSAPWGFFMALKQMPDHYFLYWEDVLLSWQALAKGFSLWVVPEIEISHDEKEAQPVSAERRYYLARNGAFTMERNTPVGTRQFWWVYNRLRYLYHHLPGSDQVVRQGLRDAVRGTLGKKEASL